MVPNRLWSPLAVRIGVAGSAGVRAATGVVGADGEGSHGVSGDVEELPAEVVHAGCRQVQPAQVGFEMEQGIVGEQGDRHAGVTTDGGQRPHALEVGVALGVDDRLDGPSRQDRQHDFREQRGLQVGLGGERGVQPAFELGNAVRGDRVAPPFGTLAALDGIQADAPVRLEPGQGRVDLGERDRMIGREVLVDEALQVVTVQGLLFQQAENRVGYAHGGTIN